MATLILTIGLGGFTPGGASASSKASASVLPKANRAAKSASLDDQSVPALLGDPGIESSVDSDSPGMAEAFPFVAGSSGTVGAASVYIDAQSSASMVLVGLYADSDGQPGSLLTAGTISSPTVGSWDSIALDPASVVEGDTYWISVLGVGGTIVFRDNDAGPCSSITSAQGDLSSLPQVWSSGTSWPTCSISAYVTGSSTSPPAVSAPTNTAPPTISGTPQQGDTLTTSTGSWANSPTSYSYQWQDCDASGANCVNIAGATSQSYEAATSDEGFTLEVVVTATNAGGSTSVSAAAVGPVTPPPPQNTALPVISGTAQAGQTLTVSNGTWTGSPTGYGYQWQDCDASGANCVNIAGATSQSYEAATSDEGFTLEVVATATNAGGSTSVSAAAVGPVTPPPADTVLPVISGALPVISGTTQQGSTLSTTNGSWSNSPTSYSYQWQRCVVGSSCANISGAISNSYVLTPTDVGNTIDVVVTGINEYGSTPATSAETGAIASNGNVIFSDDFSGSSLSPAWTIISRHGEYAQNETECNIPQEVSVNNMLDITTIAQNTVCGDFNLDGSVRHAPQTWPYATGDIQWTNFNFTYGTVTYTAKFPAKNTGTWPAIWLLGANCQATNIVTADVGYSTCPNLNSPGYVETDMTECLPSNWCQLASAQPSSFPTCGYNTVDTNWHTYSLTWNSSGIYEYMDGQQVCSFTAAEGYAIPSTPMFLIIQTQTGGVGGTPDNANLPANLYVSNVTVTQP